MKPRVLIPTNDVGFASDLAEAYGSAGYEAVVGKENLFLTTATFDIVHLQWPEEFTGWSIPDERSTKKIEKALEHWSSNSRIILSVHNLYPHRFQGDAGFHKLYSMFFRSAHLISYFSPASMKLVQEHYGDVADKASLMHGLFNYDRLRKGMGSQTQARQELGLSEKDFVILVFGAIRSWDEVVLIRKAMDRCSVPEKRLLMAGRYIEYGPVWRQRFRRIQWKAWLKARKAVVIKKYVPDEDVHKLLNAADVVLVPRIRDISSGLVPLAMTFGKVVVAPNHGAFPDYLKGTDNPLYKSGDANSLAEALNKLAAMNLEQSGKLNRKIADDWSWDKIVKDCLDNLNKNTN